MRRRRVLIVEIPFMASAGRVQRRKFHAGRTMSEETPAENFLFAYKGAARVGGSKLGLIRARNRADALRRLKRRSIYVTALKEARVYHLFLARLARRAIGRRWLATFFGSMAMLIRGGSPIIDSLEATRASLDGARGDFVDRLIRSVNDGRAFSSALAEGEIDHSVGVIAAFESGEATGRLDRAFESAKRIIEKEIELTRIGLDAIRYPLIVASVGVGALLFAALWVAPRFERIYLALGIELPFLTRLILDLSQAARSFFPIALAMGALLGLGAFFFIRESALKSSLNAMLRRTPYIGELFHSLSMARWALTLSELLASGHAIVSALEKAAGSAGSRDLTRLSLSSAAEIAKGIALSETSIMTGKTDAIVAQMILAGERSGALDEALKNVSLHYEEKTRRISSAVATLIEPILIFALSAITLIFALAVYAPIWKITELAR